jgi:probable blue pigment (indigoidine) exporter
MPVSPLLLLSPVTAVLLGWLFLDQTLTALQIAGGILVIGSIWLAQRPNRRSDAASERRAEPGQGAIRSA